MMNLETTSVRKTRKTMYNRQDPLLIRWIWMLRNPLMIDNWFRLQVCAFIFPLFIVQELFNDYAICSDTTTREKDFDAIFFLA